MQSAARNVEVPLKNRVVGQIMAAQNDPGVQTSMHEADRGRNQREERAQSAGAASKLGGAAEQPVSKVMPSVSLRDRARLRPVLRAPSSREGAPEVQEGREAAQGERMERAQSAGAASTLGGAAEQPTSKVMQTVSLRDRARLRPGMHAPSSREGVPEVQEGREAAQGERKERAQSADAVHTLGVRPTGAYRGGTHGAHQL